MLTADDRGRVLAAVRATDATLADKLTEELSDRGHAVNVARAVAADETMAKIIDKAVDVLARHVAVEEQRERRWEALLGRQGLIALVLTGAFTLATAIGSAYFGGHVGETVNAALHADDEPAP